MDLNKKAKYWCGICYPESMPENWQDVIGECIPLPLAYCKHDADKIEKFDDKLDCKKVHVHVLVAFPNTTTYNHAKDTFNQLQLDGKGCFPTISPVASIESMYDYLIHDTDACKKRGKHLYDKTERICLNGFDIGDYKSVSSEEKQKMATELCKMIIEEDIDNISDFYMNLVSNYDTEYLKLYLAYSGPFERLCKGNYQKHYRMVKGI